MTSRCPSCDRIVPERPVLYRALIGLDAYCEDCYHATAAALSPAMQLSLRRDRQATLTPIADQEAHP